MDGIISLEGISGHFTAYFERLQLLPVCFPMFVRTTAFNKLEENVKFSAPGSTVTLKGPTGVGKSLALVAVSISLQETHQCIILTPLSSKTVSFLKVLKEICASCDVQVPELESVESANITAMLEIFFRVLIAHAKKPILLLDLSSTVSLDESGMSTIQDGIEVARSFNIPMVISLSSGQGMVLKSCTNPFYRRFLQSLQRGIPSVEFMPFSEEEAKLYLLCFPNIIYSGEEGMKELKALTNYNPLLLSLCVSSNSKRHAEFTVTSAIRNFADEIRKTLNSDTCSWIANNLSESMYYFYCAFNGIPLEISCMLGYITSWVAIEAITFVASEDDDNFTLEINFPTVYASLMQLLRDAFTKNLSHVRMPIVDGYYFEKYFCDEVSKLQISCAKGDECFSIVFDIAMNVQQPLTAVSLQQLNEGALYHLREKHPVIDAVGVFKNNDVLWLVMIQISLSAYRQHRSKAYDLKNAVKGPEVKCCDGATTWLQYYSNKVANTDGKVVKSLYVYVSPKQLLMQSSAESPLGVLGECGINSRTQDFYVGLVMENTPTAKFLQDILIRLM